MLPLLPAAGRRGWVLGRARRPPGTAKGAPQAARLASVGPLQPLAAAVTRRVAAGFP